MKIEIEHVSKKIKDALVLDDVCMTLESGNIYGFKGVNGSGKTMLMRAVSGLMYPTSGTISIDGKVLGKNMAFPEKIGMLIENPAFIDSYTGYDNLKMLASINKIKKTLVQLVNKLKKCTFAGQKNNVGLTKKA